MTSSRKLYARNTYSTQIELSEALSFVDTYHRQGMNKKYSNPHCYGLYDKRDTTQEELLAVVIFASPRTSKKRRTYKWELLRLCFKTGVRIPGGASKLITHFIRDVRPVNFFTYQDTSWETTDVYGLAGMSLVNDASPKKVLVRDGITYQQAQNNRQDWFSFQQASMLGPDRLLGTQIGEQYDQGRRLNNIDLFTKYCGYHVETIPGDRTYEWHNPNYIYYTYKITASDSNKYYYGRKSYYKKSRKDITQEDLLNDNYYGSGGVKFKNWKRNHNENILKEIISIHDKWGESVEKEISLIGNLYKEDSDCLNTVPGGVGTSGGTHKREYRVKKCDIHGMTQHSKNGCRTCYSEKLIHEDYCPIHGDTLFMSGNCCKCHNNGIYFTDMCSSHGKTPHTKNGCCQCTKNNNLAIQHCPTHEESLHTENGFCLRCSTKKKTQNVQHCDIHGDTSFNGEHCIKCSLDKTYSTKHCDIHGDSRHRNNTCIQCDSATKYTIDIGRCDIHGETKHINGECYQCFCDNTPGWKSFMSSRKSREESRKEGFSCPECGNRILSTMNDILSKISPIMDSDIIDNSWTVTICSECCKYDSFRKNETVQKVLRYLPEWENVSPRICSAKDTRRLDFTCPYCSMVHSYQFSTAVKYVRRNKTLCNCGGYPDG